MIQESGPSLGHYPTGTLNLDFPSSRNVRTTFPLFKSYPDHGIWLGQPEWTETSSSYRCLPPRDF